jgi:hypothetical protein
MGASFMEKETVVEQPSYYAVIPADVRYNKKLSANAKLLYAEITALTNKTGYCWSSNKYFGDLYGLSKDRISHLVSDLVDQKLIRVEITDKIYRKIYLTLAKNSYPPSYKQRTPLAKNSDIILQVNNKDNKTVSEKFLAKHFQNKLKQMPDISSNFYKTIKSKNI